MQQSKYLPKLNTQLPASQQIPPIPPSVYVNQPSREPGFTGSSKDWFDPEKFAKITITPMHYQSESDTAKSDDQYFDSYSHYYIHEEMLKDVARTVAYRDAMSKNTHLFKDKVVLDVGCGTGILSIFAAKAGAKHVYAIEAANIAHYAREIIRKNKMTDLITIIKGKCEQVELPIDPETGQQIKVDIIVSEWMGYCLLYESMLPTVIYARDNWLKPGGLVLPDKFRMVIAGCTDKFQLKIEKELWWKNVYGVDMSCLGKNFYVEPLVETVPKHTIITDLCVFKELDLRTCTIDDATFSNEYRLKVSKP